MKKTLMLMAGMAVALSLGACQTMRSMNECMEPEDVAQPAPVVQSTTTTKTTTTTVHHQ